MTQTDPDADLFLLLAVVLPPSAMDVLGPVRDERVIETRFGRVGPVALRATDQGQRVWVQPYSGLPTRTDPRAALLAAKELGVQRVLNWDLAIALNRVLGRGQPVIVTDYIDFTRHQPQTFLETEGVSGISQVPPVCPQMSMALSRALPAAAGGVYLGVDGPRRETAAESHLFRLWGADLLGQNLVPEIALAGELELCYSGLATIADASADQPQPKPEGEVRLGLEMVVESLPRFLVHLAAMGPCACANRLSAARSQGLLAEGWWK